ncbi:hypothetical protein FRC02_003045 [Tulasnella sp. 418]|nr:hypothetical protein FRC02_003045 [Tulasnella sp. 418]
MATGSHTTRHGSQTSTAPRQSVSSNQNAITSSNSLYLFTFLTTLLLLLAISCGIILRSMILRHRFRQRLQAAIEAGILIPESLLDGNQSGSLGDKPQVYDVSLAPRSDGELSEHTPSMNAWKGIQPLSATILRSSGNDAEGNNDRGVLFTPQMAADFWGIRTTPRRPFLQTLRSRNSRNTPNEPARTGNNGDVAPSTTDNLAPATTGINGAVTPQPQAEATPEKLSVAVLIAMPNPNKRQYVPSSTVFIPTHTITNSNHRDSFSFSSASSPITVDDRGKHKALYSSSDVRDVPVEEGEEEDLPEVAFGITEYSWPYGPVERSNVDGADEGSESRA